MDHLAFESCTGKGVKVAVIDSGIDVSHPDIRGVTGGQCITIDERGYASFTECYHDSIGHGTACAGIILQKAPDVQLYAIKIFQGEELEAGPEALIEAIMWAADSNIRVIHMSLGIYQLHKMDELEGACRYAQEKGCIMIAADSNEFEDSYPAMFPNVFGVVGGRIKDGHSYYFLQDSPIEFVAKGDLQRIAWKDGKSAFLGRNSFAAPHITGIICKILESKPESTFAQVKEILAAHALTGEAEFVMNSKKTVYLLKQQLKGKKSEEKSKIPWIKKACIFPYNKEMHALVRARDLLPFSVEAVVDVIGKGAVGKDAGEVIGIEKTGIQIGHNLDEALEKADTLILGHVGELEAIHKQRIGFKAIRKALQMGKNVYHLDPIRNPKDYQGLKEFAVRNNAVIASQELEEIDEKNMLAALRLKINVPVIGVFGTSAHQGKFTTQLALRKSLMQEGYTVAQIGTEPHSELFGFDLGFPIGYNAAVEWPEKKYIPFLHYKMLEMVYQKNPDIFVVGAQSGITPYDIDEADTYTLGSIAFLLATKPDAYILTINSMDSDEYVLRTIQVLEGLGQGKTICLILSDKEKEVKHVLGLTSIQYRQLSNMDLMEKIRRAEDKFNIPITEVVSEEGRQKLLETVIGFFSAK